MPELDMKKIMDGIDRQNAEFSALKALWESYRKLPAVVDDDYPEMRHYYERDLKSFLNATSANGR